MIKLVIAIGVLFLGLMLYLSQRNRVSNTDAQALVKNGAVLLDVRTRAEFADGHIPGALNIPVQELEQRMGELADKDRAIVVYCRSGSRSASATRTLVRAGYADVHNLGPMTAWR